MNEKRNVVVAAIAALFIMLPIAISTVVNSSYFSSAVVRPIFFETDAFAAGPQKHLPVLLVHGWNEDASIWKKWEELLRKDNITFNSITFKKSDDKCGAAIGHATELGEQIQRIKKETGSDHVNIVGHSKGGIDARVFLANGTTGVSNLVMLGTPNAGSPLADLTPICMPATLDIRTDANATNARMNPNTKYYTIAGDWLHDIGGSPFVPGLDDGLVAISSVQSEKYFQSLGVTQHSHAELLGAQEYNMTRDVLLGNK